MFNHYILAIPKKSEKRIVDLTLKVVIVLSCCATLLPIASLAQEDLRRFKLLSPQELNPDQLKLAESIRSGPRSSTGSTATQPNTPIGSPFNVWLRSPEMGDIIQKLGSQIRFNSSLPARLNEFAILITAQHWQAKYEWFAHYRLALKGGLSAAVADQLLLGNKPVGMQEDEATIYDFCWELHTTHFVSDATYQKAKDLFGERGIVDLIAVNGYYDLVSMTLNVDRTPVPTK
jgi:4-carboxymuconolactone decarboxylase